MLTNNPEFKKHFKLEVNTTRLAVSFGLLALIALITAQNINTNVSQAQLRDEFALVFRTFSTIGFFITILWGTYLAAASINEEARQKTWDFVRMSSLAPAKILIGKLFGSTSLIWLVTLIVIVPAILLSGSYMIDANAILKRPEFITLLQVALCGICWAVFSHAWGILMSLQTVSLASTGKEKNNSFGVALVILLAGSFIGTGIQLGFDDFTKVSPGHMTTPEWYGIDMHLLDFIMLCLAFATFWTIVGAYQVLRQTLKFRDLPLAWIAFLVTTTIFMQGFQLREDFTDFLLWPTVLSIGTMGIMVMAESRDIVAYKTFAARFSAGNYRDAARHLPLWTISAAFLVLSIILGLIFVNHSTTMVLGMLSLILFIVRDVLALHYIAWKPGVRRPILGFVIYGFLMYFLLPLMFKEIGNDLPSLFYPGLGPMKQQFSPDTTFNVIYWMFLMSQIGLAGWLFRKRWQVAFRSAKQPNP